MASCPRGEHDADSESEEGRGKRAVIFRGVIAHNKRVPWDADHSIRASLGYVSGRDGVYDGKDYIL